MLIKDYLEKKIELHQLLNSYSCPEDIDSQFKELHSEPIIKKQTDLIFKKNEKYLSPHDAVIEKIKFLKGTITLDFKFKAFIFEDRMEVGYQDVQLLIEITKPNKIVAKKGNTIFTCVFDGNQMGLITLDNNWNHQKDIVEYTNITMKLGDIYPLQKAKKFRK